MPRALTDLQIQSLKPGRERREIPDPGARGLYIIVQPSGSKSFAVRYRFAGQPKKLTLKSGISLAAARRLCAAAMHDVAEGRDPSVAKREAVAKAAAARADTLRAVCEEYLKRESGKLRSARERERLLERLVFPGLGCRNIHSIARGELVRLFDKIEDENGPVMADMTLAVLSRIFNWYSIRDESFRTPLARGMRRVKANERARSRVLDDGELRRVWKAASKSKGAFAPLLRFLLLTGARRTEAAEMKWGELGNGSWCLPASRNKTKAELCRPLGKAAHAVLDKLPRIAGCEFVFTNDGSRPIAAFSKFKRAFDQQCGVTNWVLHDLRRTARSLMSRAGVSADIAERCLGHVIPGVRGVYDRHQYRDEMLTAYERLAALIDNIVHVRENIVPLRR